MLSLTMWFLIFEFRLTVPLPTSDVSLMICWQKESTVLQSVQ